MAGVIRFADGAVAAELAGESTSQDVPTEDRAGVTTLPDSTAVAFGISLPDGWAQEYVEMLGALMGTGGSVDQMLADAEAMTGLELPEDLERLLGEGVAVAADRDLDVAAASHDPAAIPAGVRVSGDTAEINDVLAKVRTALGPMAQALVVEEGDGVVALGLDADYVRELAGEGTLGDQAVFQEVVPDAQRGYAQLFVDFDAVDAWVAQGMEQAGQAGPDEQKVQENLAPLRALGVSSWAEDDGSERSLLRLSTD
jgi:hypothetical protein